MWHVEENPRTCPAARQLGCQTLPCFKLEAVRARTDPPAARCHQPGTLRPTVAAAPSTLCWDLAKRWLGGTVPTQPARELFGRPELPARSPAAVLVRPSRWARPPPRTLPTPPARHACTRGTWGTSAEPAEHPGTLPPARFQGRLGRGEGDQLLLEGLLALLVRELGLQGGAGGRSSASPAAARSQKATGLAASNKARRRMRGNTACGPTTCHGPW